MSEYKRPIEVIMEAIGSWDGKPTDDQARALVDDVYAAFNAMTASHAEIHRAGHWNLCCSECGGIFIRTCGACERCCIVRHSDALAKRHAELYGHEWTVECGPYSCNKLHPGQPTPPASEPPCDSADSGRDDEKGTTR